jgi:S-adenosyl-L-methionine hydrolase (adenosine-forming)
MKANGLLALLTDFGTSDWYVASMKAMATSTFRDVRLIDITHEISPGSISEGAFVLSRCYDDFPPGTTFVVVVDPGVGTDRQPIVLAAGNYFFVGPNNGVLYPTICQLVITGTFCIESPTWMGPKRSSTFHGRDIFAPSGAKLASGTPLHEAGPPIQQVVDLKFPGPKNLTENPNGRILYFDRFGNGFTNFRKEHIETKRLIGIRSEETLFPFAGTFGDVKPGAPVSYWGSSGFLEVAIRNGNAKSDANLTLESIVWPVFSS